VRSFLAGLFEIALASALLCPPAVSAAGSRNEEPPKARSPDGESPRADPSSAPSWNDEGFVLPESVAKAIESAAPAAPVVKPARPRKVLAYGRVPTHPESAAACFKALEILARKTGAFEVVLSGDPEALAPESLAAFDAVVMNNTHEGRPLLPRNFGDLSAERQKAAVGRETILKKSLLDFVSGGKGIVGIHGATAGVGWKEYLEMMGGDYADHFVDSVWVRVEEPGNPLCAGIGAGSLQVRDEFYIFGEPYSRKRVRVLLSLDLERTKDPGKRPDRDYPVSWIRRHGKGRVFYGSLGHTYDAYVSPQVLRHYLAGIQFATGDLEAEAEPRGAGAPGAPTKPEAPGAAEPKPASEGEPRNPEADPGRRRAP